MQCEGSAIFIQHIEYVEPLTNAKIILFSEEGSNIFPNACKENIIYSDCMIWNQS